MLVGSRMTCPVISVGMLTEIPAALETIRKNQITFMPVVDRERHLMGIVSREQLEAADENCENVAAVMTKNCLRVTDKTPIEEAMRILMDYDVQVLPVVQDDVLVGIFTPESLGRLMLDLTGSRQSGVRLTVRVADSAAGLGKLMEVISGLKGNVNSVFSYNCSKEDGLHVTLKVDDVDKFKLKQAIDALDMEVIDIR